ncbi:endo alpha-1,4 polygalactosaminidase [Mesonia maritima]|uniref:endo alpha-1,4 polygalactosaminidase n=1 Tax=Mesonia maritima TaxID=1793873 RepID=UPI00362E2225
MVIAYLSIGEAEDYRYYWKESWNRDFPDFIEAENPEWEGNFKVKYWEEEWQEIIYGNEEAYLSKIMNAGFQGVYLDIIDAYEYFE